VKSLADLVGPFLFAAANFLAALGLQQFEPAHIFGLFAFAQVAIATGMGISNGAFGTALVVMLAKGELESSQILGSFLRAKLLFCSVAAVLLVALLLLADAAPSVSVIVGCVGVIMWLRWYFRSIELGLHRHNAAIASDLVYGGLALVGLLILFVVNAISMWNVILLQGLASLASLLTLYHSIGKSTQGIISASLATFKHSFVRYGRWALVATGATELTSHAPAYFITLTLGPQAFAPVAVATLLFRPLGVALTGLVLFERPRMARAVAQRCFEALDRNVRSVRAIVVATWVANLIIVLLLLGVAPGLVARESYDPGMLTLACALTAIVVLMRAVREPTSAALEAGGSLRGLAHVALLSAPLTIAGVVTLLFIVPGIAVLALIGTILGETLNLALVVRRYRRFTTDLRGAVHD
jgi:putative peptidoglycan lipid II flippase